MLSVLIPAVAELIDFSIRAASSVVLVVSGALRGWPMGFEGE